MKKKILILGVGNILFRDEGLGVRALEYIRDNYSHSDEISLVDGGSGGMSLGALFKGHTHVIIIDALNSKNLPGTVLRVTKDNVGGIVSQSSLHGFAVEELISVAALEGYDGPVVIFGMEPLDISPGLELSPLVRLRIPLVAEMVREELKRQGVGWVKRSRPNKKICKRERLSA